MELTELISPIVRHVHRQKAWKIEESGVSENTVLFMNADIPCDDCGHAHSDVIWVTFTPEALDELKELLDAES